MAHITSTTARAIITIADRVLLAQGKDDHFFHAPGGHVEAGELPANALRRELREELGRDIGDLVFLGTLENVFDNREDDVEHETMYVFRATLYPGLFDNLPESQEDWLRFRWVQMTDLRKVNLLPPTLDQWIMRVGGG